MHFTLVRNWLLKFAVLGVYSVYVLGSRGPALPRGDAHEALKSVKAPSRIVIVLPRIAKRIVITFPRLPRITVPCTPHIS